jgi:acyl-CoA reductase-like NAD-dependent aldehyde dehydrogenase
MAGPGGIDERKIEEIVARVLERLGGGPRGPGPSGSRAEPPAAAPATAVNLPRGSNGVYADADQAAKAARRAFEQNERTPVATRTKMVEAMRRAVLANNDALSRYAVEETGLGGCRPRARREDACPKPGRRRKTKTRPPEG